MSQKCPQYALLFLEENKGLGYQNPLTTICELVVNLVNLQLLILALAIMIVMKTQTKRVNIYTCIHSGFCKK